MVNALFSIFNVNILVYFGLLILIGFNTGGSFVNGLYKIKMSNKLERTEKELALNVTTMFKDAAILLASLFALLLSLTVFAAAAAAAATEEEDKDIMARI